MSESLSRNDDTSTVAIKKEQNDVEAVLDYFLFALACHMLGSDRVQQMMDAVVVDNNDTDARIDSATTHLYRLIWQSPSLVPLHPFTQTILQPPPTDLNFEYLVKLTLTFDLHRSPLGPCLTLQIGSLTCRWKGDSWQYHYCSHDFTSRDFQDHFQQALQLELESNSPVLLAKTMANAVTSLGTTNNLSSKQKSPGTNLTPTATAIDKSLWEHSTVIETTDKGRCLCLYYHELQQTAPLFLQSHTDSLDRDRKDCPSIVDPSIVAAILHRSATTTYSNEMDDKKAVGTDILHILLEQWKRCRKPEATNATATTTTAPSTSPELSQQQEGTSSLNAKVSGVRKRPMKQVMSRIGGVYKKRKGRPKYSGET